MTKPELFASCLLRKLGFILLAVLLITGLCFEPVSARDDFPPAHGPVNDFAGVISASDAARIENLSRELLQKTGASVVVATLSSLGDQDLNDYVNRLYQSWGIGKKGEDRGVLIFLALQERKIRIEVGYGLEGILPDGRVGGILDQYVIPHLKKGEYSLGLVNAVTAVSLVIAEDAGVTLTGKSALRQPGRTTSQRSGYGFWFLLMLILFLLLGTRRGRGYLPLILMMLFSSGGRRGGGSGDLDGFGSFGGGFGGFGGGGSGGGGAGRDF